MKKIESYIPHTHIMVLFFIGFLIVWKLPTFISFMKEMLSEQLPNGSPGKASSKRSILFLFSLGFIYGWIYSLQTNIQLDHYVITLIIIFLLLGLAIIKPDQANTLLDKLKGLTNFARPEESEVKPEAQPNKTTITTKVETQTPN